MTLTNMTPKSKLSFIAFGETVSDLRDLDSRCEISDTDRRHLADVADNLDLFDEAAPSGVWLNVSVYCCDDYVHVYVQAVNGEKAVSLMSGGTPLEARIATGAVESLQQV